jgi:hypothetical protein
MKRQAAKRQVAIGCRFSIRGRSSPEIMGICPGVDGVERIDRGMFSVRLSGKWSRVLSATAVLCPKKPTAATVQVGGINLRKKSVAVGILKLSGDIGKSIMWDYPRSVAEVHLRLIVE